MCQPGTAGEAQGRGLVWQNIPAAQEAHNEMVERDISAVLLSWRKKWAPARPGAGHKGRVQRMDGISGCHTAQQQCSAANAGPARGRGAAAAPLRAAPNTTRSTAHNIRAYTQHSTPPPPPAEGRKPGCHLTPQAVPWHPALGPAPLSGLAERLRTALGRPHSFHFFARAQGAPALPNRVRPLQLAVPRDSSGSRGTALHLALQLAVHVAHLVLHQRQLRPQRHRLRALPDEGLVRLLHLQQGRAGVGVAVSMGVFKKQVGWHARW